MKRHSFEEVMRLDQSLHHLAMYEVTKGRIINPQTVDEAAEWHVKIANKFNEFKHLIQKGECTYEFIKQHVLSQNGPFPKGSMDVSSPEFLQQIQEWEREDRKENDESSPENVVKSLINKMITEIFPGAASVDVKMIRPDGKEQQIKPCPLNSATEESPKESAIKKKRTPRKKKT